MTKKEIHNTIIFISRMTNISHRIEQYAKSYDSKEVESIYKDMRKEIFDYKEKLIK